MITGPEPGLTRDAIATLLSDADDARSNWLTLPAYAVAPVSKRRWKKCPSAPPSRP